MRLLRIGHVNLSVSDVEAAKHFYGNLLGLEATGRPSDAGREGCWFRCGDVELHCSFEADSGNSQSKRHVAFELDDVDDARRRLASAGCSIEEGRPLPGTSRFFVRDPSGNRLEFYQRL